MEALCVTDIETILLDDDHGIRFDDDGPELNDGGATVDFGICDIPKRVIKSVYIIDGAITPFISLLKHHHTPAQASACVGYYEHFLHTWCCNSRSRLY